MMSQSVKIGIHDDRGDGLDDLLRYVSSAREGHKHMHLRRLVSLVFVTKARMRLTCLKGQHAQ